MKKRQRIKNFKNRVTSLQREKPGQVLIGIKKNKKLTLQRGKPGQVLIGIKKNKKLTFNWCYLKDINEIL